MTLATESPFFTGRSLQQLILGGLFDRFDELRYVVTEGGSGRILERLATLDAILARTNDWQAFADFLGRANPLRKTAVEVWEYNCFVGASTMTAVEGRMRRSIGVPQMMFGIDYPHFEGTYPRTKDNIRATLTAAGADEAELRAILGENAVRCYGFGPEVLACHVERVGFEMAELLEPIESPSSEVRVY